MVHIDVDVYVYVYVYVAIYQYDIMWRRICMPCGVVWIATRCMLCMCDGVVCYVLVISISTESMCGGLRICISMAASSSCMCMRMCSRQYVVVVMPSAVWSAG